MAKDKYDFIQELLENKKLQPAQKERVLMLTKEEIKKDGIASKDLEERVKNLEEIFKTSDKEQTIILETTKTPIENFDLPKYVDSKNLYRFLEDYNQDMILKTTCHEIDSDELKNILTFCEIEEYDFLKHKEKVQEQYKSLFFNNKRYFVDHKIKNLILFYLTGKSFSGKSEGWTDENIKYNWESEELKNWSKNNANKIPHPNEGFAGVQKNDGLELEKPIKLNLIKNNQQIRYFSELVLHFKHLFHVRSDNSLRKIIENCNLSYEWIDRVDFKINDEAFPYNIEFFTNVEKLIQAYKVLINLIIEVSYKNELGKPIVELKFTETSKGVELSIHHINTIFQKTKQNTIERKGSTFTNLIKNQINGLCEFYLKADFGNSEYAEINIWNGKNSTYIPIDNFKGVEFILKFNKR